MNDDTPKDDDKKKEGGPGPFIAESLFKARTILICGEINQKLAREVMAQLLAMDAENDNDIILYLNSQGGHVEAGDTIHDMIKFVKSKVKIVGTGWVASAGAHIYVSVPKKDRYCLPNTRFLLHQPSGASFGVASDIAIEAEQIIKMRERLNRILAEQTGQPYEKIEEDTNRDFWLTAEEAKNYGLVGKIIKSPKEM